jgi:hypothetical protein
MAPQLLTTSATAAAWPQPHGPVPPAICVPHAPLHRSHACHSARLRGLRSGVPQPVRNSPRRRPPRYNGDGLGSTPNPAKCCRHVLGHRQLQCPPAPGPGQMRVQLLRRLPARTCMQHAARRWAESWSSVCLCHDRRVLCSTASLMTSPWHYDYVIYFLFPLEIKPELHKYTPSPNMAAYRHRLGEAKHSTRACSTLGSCPCRAHCSYTFSWCPSGYSSEHSDHKHFFLRSILMKLWDILFTFLIYCHKHIMQGSMLFLTRGLTIGTKVPRYILIFTRVSYM